MTAEFDLKSTVIDRILSDVMSWSLRIESIASGDFENINTNLLFSCGLFSRLQQLTLHSWILSSVVICHLFWVWIKLHLCLLLDLLNQDLKIWVRKYHHRSVKARHIFSCDNSINFFSAQQRKILYYIIVVPEVLKSVTYIWPKSN